MRRKITFNIAGVFLTMAVSVFSVQSAGSEEIPLTPIEQLGKILFFDANLSLPPGQSCATCHAATVGFTGPDPEINVPGAVYPGALNTRFGNRKPPTAAYGGDSPVLYYDKTEGMFVGGMFWDGRATGKNIIGDPLAEQAQGPFLNPLEHNLPNAAKRSRMDPVIRGLHVWTEIDFRCPPEQFVCQPFMSQVTGKHSVCGQAQGRIV